MLALLIPCFTVPSQVFQLTPGDFDLDSSLPLQLCDFAWVTAVWGLWTHQRLPVALTYYWGIVLTSQGILTPSLGQEFPHPRFFAFWCMHFLIVWAALYLTLGLGIAPNWRTYRITVALTALWAVLVYVFDVVADVNYGYLVRKPGSGSLLDPLGPWPVYVVAALGILLAVWALMTWPWVAHARREGAGRPLAWPHAQRTHGRAGADGRGRPDGPASRGCADAASGHRVGGGDRGPPRPGLRVPGAAARRWRVTTAATPCGPGRCSARRGAAVEAVLLSSTVHAEGLAALRAAGGRTVLGGRGAPARRRRRRHRRHRWSPRAEGRGGRGARRVRGCAGRRRGRAVGGRRRHRPARR